MKTTISDVQIRKTNKKPSEPVMAPRAFLNLAYIELLLFQHRDLRPAGGGFGELAGGEVPDDELPDPVGGLGVLAVNDELTDTGRMSQDARHRFPCAFVKEIGSIPPQNRKLASSPLD